MSTVSHPYFRALGRRGGKNSPVSDIGAPSTDSTQTHSALQLIAALLNAEQAFNSPFTSASAIATHYVMWAKRLPFFDNLHVSKNESQNLHTQAKIFTNVCDENSMRNQIFKFHKSFQKVDQVALLNNALCDIILLTISQHWNHGIDLLGHHQCNDGDKEQKLDLRRLYGTINQITGLNLNFVEYACLKAMLLFSVGKCSSLLLSITEMILPFKSVPLCITDLEQLMDPTPIRYAQEEVQAALEEYLHCTMSSNHPSRLGYILLRWIGLKTTNFGVLLVQVLSSKDRPMELEIHRALSSHSDFSKMRYHILNVPASSIASPSRGISYEQPTPRFHLDGLDITPFDGSTNLNYNWRYPQEDQTLGMNHHPTFQTFYRALREQFLNGVRASEV